MSTRWGDLRARVISAAVMLAVGAVEIWLGGTWFLVLVAALIGVMIWELCRLTAPVAPGMALGLGIAAACILGVAEVMPNGVTQAALVFPVLAVLVTPRRDRVIAAVFAAALMLSGHGLFLLREEAGVVAILWVLGIVIVSDVAGYFVGRLVGGPKFWPAISPKKTWSGTVAGWVGAGLLGYGFWAQGLGGAALIWLSPLIAFAGQLGDIGESWIKRRAGVKDASSLIPGHGGVMDRFDALVGAMVVVMAASVVMTLPVGG
jgi:phosphatidate cytidylyltransferase